MSTDLVFSLITEDPPVMWVRIASIFGRQGARLAGLRAGPTDRPGTHRWTIRVIVSPARAVRLHRELESQTEVLSVRLQTPRR